VFYARFYLRIDKILKIVKKNCTFLRLPKFFCALTPLTYTITYDIIKLLTGMVIIQYSMNCFYRKISLRISQLFFLCSYFNIWRKRGYLLSADLMIRNIKRREKLTSSSFTGIHSRNTLINKNNQNVDLKNPLVHKYYLCCVV
jgi:hypothetical protein